MVVPEKLYPLHCPLGIELLSAGFASRHKSKTKVGPEVEVRADKEGEILHSPRISDEFCDERAVHWRRIQKHAFVLQCGGFGTPRLGRGGASLWN